jgi:hypothetical protein
MDQLRADIRSALGGHVDPDLFEECACALLRDDGWLGLVPIPGGNDAGLDGRAASPSEPPVGLVATTSRDALRNLTSSLKRHRETGGAIRRVLFATTGTLSAPRERSLHERAAVLGFTLLNVYQQQAFVDRLYQRHEWRKQLLGLSGAPEALSEYPRVWRPVLRTPLIGRDDDLKRLRSMRGDFVVEGQPGAARRLCSKR